MEDKVKKSRSPQFPFINLQRAVERARAFEAAYHQHPARAGNAVKEWGYSEKSSGGIQTVAALCAYGLMDDEGALDARKLKLTPRAMTILKDSRPGAKEKATREAALAPKVLNELFLEWGGVRPPDNECISHLMLDRSFAEDGARRLLQVYDANISFAQLLDSDKIGDIDELEPEILPPFAPDKTQQSAESSAVEPTKVAVMQNERVVFAHEIRPNQSFRLVVTGEVDSEMVEALAAFTEFQKKLIKPKKPAPQEAD